MLAVKVIRVIPPELAVQYARERAEREAREQAERAYKKLAEQDLRYLQSDSAIVRNALAVWHLAGKARFRESYLKRTFKTHKDLNKAYAQECAKTAHHNLGDRYIELRSGGVTVYLIDRMNKEYSVSSAHGKVGSCKPLQYQGSLSTMTDAWTKQARKNDPIASM